MKTELTSKSVVTVLYDEITPGWEAWLLFTGDRHHDNLLCDREHEKADLEKAKQRGALIIDVGDLFCAMQGKYDPRSDLGQVRTEDAAPDYLDRITNHAADFYTPYTENFLVIGKGNHETRILDRHGVDLTSNLVHRINSAGGRCYAGGLGGWVRFQFHLGGSKGGTRRVKLLKWFHGAGGGGPVTRGVIQSNRQAVYLPDADIVVNGHTHDAWNVPIARERLNRKGTIERDIVHYLRTPGYKDEYRDGSEGWAVERWSPPKPLGCVWVRFTVDYTAYDISTEVLVDVR